MQLKLQQSGEGAGKCPVPLNWAHSAREAHLNRKACKSTGMKVVAPPLDLPCKKPMTYQGDILNYSGNPPKEETDRHSFPLNTRMSRDPYTSHRIVSGKIIQCSLAVIPMWM